MKYRNFGVVSYPMTDKKVSEEIKKAKKEVELERKGKRWTKRFKAKKLMQKVTKHHLFASRRRK